LRIPEFAVILATTKKQVILNYWENMKILETSHHGN